MSGLNTIQWRFVWFPIAVMAIITFGGTYYFSCRAVDIGRQDQQRIDKLEFAHKDEYKVRIRCHNCYPEDGRYAHQYEKEMWILKGTTIMDPDFKCSDCNVPFSFGRE